MDEIVRAVTPVNHMMRTRTAARDSMLRGNTIRLGERLVLVYDSAKRDEEVLESPNRLDLERHPNRRLGFGISEHFCLEANLTRIAGGSLFRELTSRLAFVERVGDTSRTASKMVQGLKSLPIRFRMR